MKLQTVLFAIVLTLATQSAVAGPYHHGFHHGGYDPWFWPYWVAPIAATAIIMDNQNPPPPTVTTVIVPVQTLTVPTVPAQASNATPTAYQVPVAIPMLDASSLDSNVRNDLTRRLRTDLPTMGNYQALTTVANATCVSNPECLLQIGRSVGAHVILAGSVIPMDKSWQISLRFINTQNGQILGLVTETSPDLVGIYVAQTRALQTLAGKTTPASSSINQATPATGQGANLSH